MDIGLKRLLGLDEDGKRVYRFVSGEVTREEYDYCCTLNNLVFGEGGYIETLGPTWELVSDPRFIKIENAFIINRRAVFGGDAHLGKQYISSDGTFTSTIADLEQYAETLGEGRYFYYVLSHPDKECPLRNWYLRIFPEMVEKEGITVPSPDSELKCECRSVAYQPDTDARDVKNWPDDKIWDLISRECPNYFNKEGKPNAIAKRLFDLFKSDLLGLIADYAVTPISDVYIELDTGDILAQQSFIDQNGYAPHVFLEVDILERALTQRAVLRATAAKILRQSDFKSILKELGDIRLTDIERDNLLRIIYQPKIVAGMVFDPGSNWFGFLKILNEQIAEFIKGIQRTGLSYEEREREQLSRASERAKNTFYKLVTGEKQVINQFNEPEVDVELDPHAKVMEAIIRNPIKRELFIVWAEAELRTNENDNDLDRLNMHRLYSMLTPVFTDPEFEVSEELYQSYIDEAIRLGYFNKKLGSSEGVHYNTRNVEKAVEAFHAYTKNHKPGCEWYDHFTSHIDETTGKEFDCEHPMPCPCKLDLLKRVEGSE